MDIEIDPADLKALLGTTSSVVLLDVREPWECQVARIEAAKHIPMGQVPSRAHAELDPESHIVAICHHGGF